MRGRMIAIYGVNNLGKTSQAKKIVEWLEGQGILAFYKKYPHYDETFGGMINRYLRAGNPDELSHREAQILYAADRLQVAGAVEDELALGHWIVAEDYTGTGIAWGMARGVDKEFLMEINSVVREPDLSFLFRGERFTQAIETGHLNESDSEMTRCCAVIHDQLGVELGWVPVEVNRDFDEITEEIISVIRERLF